MKGISHSIVGFTSAVAVVVSISITKSFFGVSVIPWLIPVVASAGAYKADLDLPMNKSARKGFGIFLDLIQKVPFLKKVFGHRGLTHSYIIPAGFVYLSSMMMDGAENNLATKAVSSLIIGYAIGYASHIFIDLYNGKGCYPFLPIPIKLNVSSITTETAQEYIFIAIFLGLELLHIFSQLTGIGLFYQ